MNKRMKRILAKIFRWIWIASVPGMLFVVLNCFFLGNPLPPFGLTKPFSFISLFNSYAIISIITFPTFIVTTYALMRSIYHEHWEEAYKKQRSGRYKKDHDLWNDKDWYK